MRFSYAFPDFRDEPGRVCETILETARPFGTSLTGHVARLLRWTFQPFFEQPIVGLAYDDPDSWAFKFYYQVGFRFHDHAVQWLARLIPWGSLRWIVGGALLHLIGVDLGPSGVRCVKLYFVHQDIETTRLAGVLLPPGLAEFLAERGVFRFSNLLTIHRLRSPDDPGIRHVSEVDFPLTENGLHDIALFGDSGMLSAVLPGLSPPPVCSGGFSRFLRTSNLDGTLLRVIRMTLSTTSDPKVNLYFHVVEKAADD